MPPSLLPGCPRDLCPISPLPVPLQRRGHASLQSTPRPSPTLLRRQSRLHRIRRRRTLPRRENDKGLIPRSSPALRNVARDRATFTKCIAPTPFTWTPSKKASASRRSPALRSCLETGPSNPSASWGVRSSGELAQISASLWILPTPFPNAFVGLNRSTQIMREPTSFTFESNMGGVGENGRVIKARQKHLTSLEKR